MVDIPRSLGAALIALFVPLAVAPVARAQGEQPLPALPAPSATSPAPASPGVAPLPVASATAPPVGPRAAVTSPPADLPGPVATGCPDGARTRCHDGFYVRMAMGFGATAISGHGASGSSVSISGASIPLRIAIGSTVGKSVVLGATLFGAATVQGSSSSGIGGAQASFGALNFLVDWYPSPEGGWHVGGDVGVGVISLTQNVGAGADLSLSAFGGYDWWFADQWSFGPMLAVSGGSLAAINDSNNNDTGYRLRAGSIAALASFVYH